MNKILVEIVKTDLKNSIESGLLNPQQQLIAINDALKWLATLNDEKINNVIEKYLERQREQQDILIHAQERIFENAKNIYKHLTTEL